mgnify:CR=1
MVNHVPIINQLNIFDILDSSLSMSSKNVSDVVVIRFSDLAEADKMYLS